jgi:hypothetical protein
MNPALLTEDDLRAWLGYERRADLERALQTARVPVVYGRGGRLCTTLDAVHAGMGLPPAGTPTPEPTPDFL